MPCGGLLSSGMRSGYGAQPSLSGGGKWRVPHDSDELVVKEGTVVPKNFALTLLRRVSRIYNPRPPGGRCLQPLRREPGGPNITSKWSFWYASSPLSRSSTHRTVRDAVLGRHPPDGDHFKRLSHSSSVTFKLSIRNKCCQKPQRGRSPNLYRLP